MTFIKLVPPQKTIDTTGQEAQPSPLQLMTQILADPKFKNTEEIFTILVDADGVITTTHSGLTLERVLFYVATTQQMILDEIRGKDVC